MNVVIIEDDHLMALFLEETLDNLGCNIIGFFDEGKPMLEFAQENSIDLVIMDVEIVGDIDGIKLAVELRERFNTPSFFITSHSDSDTINSAMQAEPLGYVIKPVTVNHIKSVVDVVKGLLGKEIKPREEIPAALGMGFTYYASSKSLFNNNHPIDLTPCETKLVDICIRSRGLIVPYAMIRESIWGDKIVSESTRRGLFYRLRKKLNNQLFETISGIGCRIQLPEKQPSNTLSL